MILRIRERTRVVVAFGDCAVTGNVTALRNPLGSAEPVLRRSFVEQADLQPRIPSEPGSCRS
jgi:NAD-reducing hydrogenase small subunit